MGNPNNETDEKKKKKKFLPIIIIASVLLLGGAGVTLGILSKGQTPTNPTESEEPSETEEPMPEGQVQLWWNVDRELYAGQSEIGTSSRQPDKDDGYYHITFATEGRQVTRRVAEKKLVNIIDGNDLMALEFDEKGIIVGVNLVDACTGGYEVKGWYVVSRDTENYTYVANSAATLQGMDEDFSLPEDCRIFDVSGAKNFVGSEMKFADLQEKDRIYTIYDNEGKVYRAFVTSRYYQPECYWNLERMYDSEILATTREPNADGVYEIPMACNGEQVIVKTKIRAVASTIDQQPAKCLALTFDLDGYCTKAVYAGNATGGGTFGSWYHITEMNGAAITAEKISKASDNGTVVSGELSENYRAFDVSGSSAFIGAEVFDLKVGDQIHAVKDNAGKICIVWVVGRLVDCDLFWNIERKYDSTLKKSTRTKDSQGYFHITLAVNGYQKEYITDDETLINKIDSYAARCGGIVTEGNVIEKVVDPWAKYGGSWAASWYDVLTKNGNTIHAEKIAIASDTGSVWDGEIAENCEIYNCSSNFISHMGEKTTLRVGDRVHCVTNMKKQLCAIFIVGRPIDSPIYWNISKLYNSTTKETTRKPDADGYYNFKFAVNGGNVTYRTKDKKLASSIDAIAVRCFGLKVSGDIIQKVYAASDCAIAKGGSAASWYTVQSVSGRKFTSEKMSEPYKGEKATLTLASNAKIYNVGGLYTTIGEYTTIQVGDQVQCWLNIAKQVSVAIVISRKAPTITAYCQECGEEVTWLGLTGYMTAQTDGAGNPLPLTHYYVPCDSALANQGTTPYKYENSTYSKTTNIHLDLKGYTLTQADNSRMFAQFGAGQELVVFDSSVEKTGKLISSAGTAVGDKGQFFWTMSGNSKFTLKDVTVDISALNDATGLAAFYNANTSTEWTFQNVTINAGENILKYGAVIYSAGKVTLDNVTITGGKSTEKGSVVVPNGGKLYLKNNVSISGGKLTDGSASSLYIEEGGLLYNDGLTSEDGAIKVSTETAGVFTSTGFEGLASKFQGEFEGSTITEDGGKLSINYVITGVKFVNDSETVEVGTPKAFEVKTLPGNMKNVTYVFTSEDETKVVISADGKIVGIAETGATPVNVKVSTNIGGQNFEATVPVTVTAATKALDHYHAENTNSHIATDAAKVNYTAWTDTTKLPTADGYYYLTADVVLADTYYGAENMNVHLCLNGHSVKLANADGYRTISMFFANETLSVCDCSTEETGAIYGPENATNANNQGRTFWVRYGTLNLYGGTVYGVETTHNVGGGAINVNVGATLNMYGGTVRDGYAHDTSTTTTASANGGNISNNGTTNIYGGTIRDGIGGHGGNIYNTGTLNIYGGEILNGTAGYTKDAQGALVVCGNTWRCGGNINSTGGKVNIYGGTISGGHAMNGGNIYTPTTNGVVIDGKDAKVIIKDGYAEALGGNLYGDTGATYTINNAEISNGSAINTRGGEGDGANIFSKGPKTIITNTTISGGKSSTHSSVYLRGAEVTIENSTITMTESYDKTAAHKGCLFFLNNGTTSTPKVTIKDSTIGEIFVGSITGMTLDGKVLLGTATQNGLWLPNTSVGELITLGENFSTESLIYVGSNDATTVASNGAAKIDCFKETNTTEKVEWKLEESEAKLVLKKDETSNHKHCDCGLNDCTATGHTCTSTQKWQPWTATNVLPSTSGYYYLTADMTLTATATPQTDANVHICFNGKKVTLASTLSRAITCYSNGTWWTGIKYTLTDCAETAGTMATTRKGGSDQGGMIWLCNANCGLNLYRVTLTAENGAYLKTANGGLISLAGAGTVFNMYSGTISNGCVESGTGTKYATGGNIALGYKVVMNMYGGTITGGTIRDESAWCAGGNIGQTTADATLNLYGGTISDGCCAALSTAYGTGANVSIAGYFNMYGGTITGAKATGATGGNVWCDTNSIVKIMGGTISNGTANVGPGIYTKSTKANGLTIDGTVEFTDNKTASGKKCDIYISNANTRITFGTNFAVRAGSPINIGCVSEMTFTSNAGSVDDFTAMEAEYEIQKNGDNTLKYVKKPVTTHKHIEGTNAQIHASQVEGGEWTDLNAALTKLKTEKSVASLAAAVAYLPSGNYYLSSDLNLGGQPMAAAGTDIKVCLNGHTLTGARCVLNFNVSKVSIYDCSEGEVGMVSATVGSQGANWARNNGMTVYGGNFKNCSAGTYGGGFALDGTTMDVYGGKFDGNTAGTNGGNFALNGTATLNVKDATIINGKAKLGPNLYMAKNSKLTLDNVTISGGKATEGTDHDIYMGSGALIEVKNMPADSKIVILMEVPGVITSNVVPEGYEKLFTAANEGLVIIRNDDGKLEMTAHTHCVCGGLIEDGHEYYQGVTHTCAKVEWTAWESDSKLPQYDDLKEGDNYFYLTKDVVLTGDYRPALTATSYVSDMAGRNIVICLNGHKVKAGGRFISTLADYSSGVVTQLKNLKVTITDCQEECGTIYWKDKVSFGTNQGAFAWLAGENTTVNLYNGFVDCGTMTSNASGAMVAASGLNSVFNMYGGKMTCPAKSDTTASTYIYGRGVQLSNNCQFNMYGGELTGGKITGAATWSVGGNVYVSTPNAVMNMYGGTISDGTATHGGNIATETGTINIYGGTVTGGTAFYNNGGNIMVNKGKLNIYGGTITKGTAKREGGNISIALTNATTYATFRMYGGTVSDGKVWSDNANDTHGGNIWTCGKTYITGGTISGGRAEENVSAAKSKTSKATQGYGGNIYVRGGVFEMSGADTLVTKGKAAVGGGGIYFLAEQTGNPITAKVSGGTISENYAWLGGGIAVSAWSTASNTVTIEGSPVIKDNTCGGTGYGAGVTLYTGNLIVKGTPSFSNNKSTNLASDIYMHSASTTKSIDLSGYTGTSKLKLAKGTSETALTTGVFASCGTWDETTAANYVEAASSSQRISISGGKILLQTNQPE